MAELVINKTQACISDEGSFDFYNHDIVSVSQDGYFKFWEVNQPLPPSLLKS